MMMMKLQLDAFNGSWVAAAHSIGASVISPLYGYPGSVNTPTYIPFTTSRTVQEARSLGMQILPWTVVR